VRRLCDAENQVLTVATLVVRNTNEAMVAPARESRVRQSVLGRCIWQKCGFIRREDVFTYNLLYTQKVIIFVLSVRFSNMMLQ
jgi:hypothetical protein